MRSVTDRRSRKTSASSNSKTAPQLVAHLNHEVKLSSTASGLVPMSAHVKDMRGFLISSATHSSFLSASTCHQVSVLSRIPAVYVLPTPGLPWSNTILPSPLLSMKSALHVALLVNFRQRLCSKFRVAVGIASVSISLSLNWGTAKPSTRSLSVSIVSIRVLRK